MAKMFAYICVSTRRQRPVDFPSAQDGDRHVRRPSEGGWPSYLGRQEARLLFPLSLSPIALGEQRRSDGC